MISTAHGTSLTNIFLQASSHRQTLDGDVLCLVDCLRLKEPAKWMNVTAKRESGAQEIDGIGQTLCHNDHYSHCERPHLHGAGGQTGVPRTLIE